MRDETMEMPDARRSGEGEMARRMLAHHRASTPLAREGRE